MGNCVLTRLPGTVNNDNLDKLGNVIIEVNETTAGTARAVAISTNGETVEVNALDGGYFTVSGVQRTFITFSDTSRHYLNLPYDKNFRLSISNKYALVRISAEDPNGNSTASNVFLRMKYVDYCINLMYLQIKLKDGDINVLENLQNLKLLSIQGSDNIYGSINVLSNLSLLEGIRINASEVNGDLSSIVSTHLTGSLTMYLPYTKITGSVEEFVANNVKSGHVNASLSGVILPSGVTFDGGSAYKNNSGTLKWRETTSSATGAVTDIYFTSHSKAITIDADGNKVADATPW